MGVAESKNVSEQLISAVTKTAIKFVQGETANIQNSQLIQVIDVDGDVTIEGNIVTSTIQINMQALLQTLATEQAQQDIAIQVEQVAKSLVKDINLGNISNATNIVRQTINDTIDISIASTQSCAAQGIANQTIQVSHVVHNVIIRDNHLTAVAKSIQDCIQRSIGNSSSVQTLQDMVNQTASSTAKGFSLTQLSILAGIIVLGLAVVFIGPEVAPFLAVGKNPILISILFLIIALVFLGIWWFWTGTSFSSTLWSNLYQNECKPVHVIKTIPVSDADEAARLAEQEPMCQAFDFIAQQKIGNVWSPIPRPQCILYSAYGTPCNLTTDDSPLLTTRIVHISSNPAIGQNFVLGSIWINVQTGNYQEFITGPAGTGWSVATAIHPNVFKFSHVTIMNAIVEPNTIFPPNEWELIAEDPALTFYILRKNDQRFEVKGPGYTADSTKVPNVSGYRVKVRKQWALYAAGGFLFLALVAGLVLKAKGGKVSTNKKSSKTNILSSIATPSISMTPEASTSPIETMTTSVSNTSTAETPASASPASIQEAIQLINSSA